MFIAETLKPHCSYPGLFVQTYFDTCGISLLKTNSVRLARHDAPLRGYLLISVYCSRQYRYCFVRSILFSNSHCTHLTGAGRQPCRNALLELFVRPFRFHRCRLVCRLVQSQPYGILQIVINPLTIQAMQHNSTIHVLFRRSIMANSA